MRKSEEEKNKRGRESEGESLAHKINSTEKKHEKERRTKERSAERIDHLSSGENRGNENV